MDDATATDETASVFRSPRRRVEYFFWMNDSSGGGGVGVGIGVAGVLERDFPRKRSMGFG